MPKAYPGSRGGYLRFPPIRPLDPGSRQHAALSGVTRMIRSDRHPRSGAAWRDADRLHHPPCSSSRKPVRAIRDPGAVISDSQLSGLWTPDQVRGDVDNPHYPLWPSSRKPARAIRDPVAVVSDACLIGLWTPDQVRGDAELGRPCSTPVVIPECRRHIRDPRALVSNACLIGLWTPDQVRGDAELGRPCSIPVVIPECRRHIRDPGALVSDSCRSGLRTPDRGSTLPCPG